MKNDILARLNKSCLTQKWLRTQLARRGCGVTKYYLCAILNDTNSTDSERVRGILQEASRILNQYDACFGDDKIEIGDMVCGESELGEYVSGIVLGLDPCRIRVIGGYGKETICLKPRKL